MDKDGIFISQQPEVGLLKGGLVEEGSAQETHMEVQQANELESREGSLSLVISWPAREDITHFNGTAEARYPKMVESLASPPKMFPEKII